MTHCSGITPIASLALVLLTVQGLVSRRYLTDRCALLGTRTCMPGIYDGGTALAHIKMIKHLVSKERF